MRNENRDVTGVPGHTNRETHPVENILWLVDAARCHVDSSPALVIKCERLLTLLQRIPLASRDLGPDEETKNLIAEVVRELSADDDKKAKDNHTPISDDGVIDGRLL